MFSYVHVHISIQFYICLGIYINMNTFNFAGSDGLISLHTRSLKYGKLENGQLIIVPSSLVKRLPQHYISFPWGIDVILGRNGYIWITRT
jgi:exosome complex RNA-binding protein Rrp4